MTGNPCESCDQTAATRRVEVDGETYDVCDRCAPPRPTSVDVPLFEVGELT